MKDKLQSIVDFVIEAFLDLISPIMSILALFIPASMTFISTGKFLGFTPAQQWIAALVVEFTGLSGITDAIKYWKHNKDNSYTYTAKDGSKEQRTSKRKEAPFKLALGVSIFYFVLLLGLNIALEFTIDDLLWKEILSTIAKGIFVLIAIPNILLIGARFQFKQILGEIKEKPQKAVSEHQESSTKLVESFPKDFRQLSTNQKDQIKKLSPQEISRLVGVTERTGLNWKTYLNNGHKKVEELIK